MTLKCGRKPENLEKTHTVTSRTTPGPACCETTVLTSAPLPRHHKLCLHSFNSTNLYWFYILGTSTSELVYVLMLGWSTYGFQMFPSLIYSDINVYFDHLLPQNIYPSIFYCLCTVLAVKSIQYIPLHGRLQGNSNKFPSRQSDKITPALGLARLSQFPIRHGQSTMDYFWRHPFQMLEPLKNSKQTSFSRICSFLFLLFE